MNFNFLSKKELRLSLTEKFNRSRNNTRLKSYREGTRSKTKSFARIGNKFFSPGKAIKFVRLLSASVLSRPHHLIQLKELWQTNMT